MTLLRVALLVIAGGLAGCSTVDQPRWSATIATEEVSPQSFESPRITYVVAEDPGDAAVELRGRVRASNFTEVVASTNGVLVSLAVDRGEFVEAGQVIVEAETAPNDEDLIAVEILQLEAELLIASGASDADVAAAQQLVDDARTALAPVSFILEAPTSGLVGLPSGSTREIVAGEPVVLIADPDSLVVEVELTSEQRAGLDEGATVTIAAATGSNSQTETTRIGRIIEPENPGDNTILSIPISTEFLTLGDAVNAVATLEAEPGGAWLPALAVERSDGASFVLIANDDGLQRVPVVLGRRAGELVELLEGPPAGTTVVGP